MPPYLLRCRLCHPDGVLIEPSSTLALGSAYDHALDHHRDQLLTDHDTVMEAVTVARS